MHGIKVLMAKNYIDNLSEETKERNARKSRAVDLSVLRAYRLSKRNGAEWQTDYRASSHASTHHQTDV